MGYWKTVRHRALKEAAKSVGLDTKERMLVAFVINAIISIGLWLILGQSMPASAIWTRILTAAAPFLLWPILLLWKMIEIPTFIDREKTDHIEKLESELNKKSDLEIRFVENPALMIRQGIPPQTIYMVDIENVGDKFLTDCVLKLAAPNELNYSIFSRAMYADGSENFFLRPGEIKSLSVMFFDRSNKETGYAVPSQYVKGMQWYERPANYIVLPPQLHFLFIEAFAANTKTARMTFKIEHNTSTGWSMRPLEVDEPVEFLNAR